MLENPLKWGLDDGESKGFLCALRVWSEFFEMPKMQEGEYVYFCVAAVFPLGLQMTE